MEPQMAKCCRIDSSSISASATSHDAYCFILSMTTPPHCVLYSPSYTHTRLMALFSGTTLVSQYQKGKTNLDFAEARDSEWQWHCLAPDRQPHHSVFYRPDALPVAQPTASKH